MMKLSALATCLLTSAAVVTAVAPASADAGTVQRPAPASAASATSPAPADVSATQVSGKHTSFTKGTAVWFANETSDPVWVREHHIFTDWYPADRLDPGESKTYVGNFGGVDDVQLRVFRSQEDARSNSVFKAIEVDAENPAYSSPWMSVSYVSKYYGVGTIHHYVSPIAGATFMGQRQADTPNYKYFDLRMQKGWSAQPENR